MDRWGRVRVPKKYANPYAVKHGRGCKYSRDVPLDLQPVARKKPGPVTREHHPPSSLAMYATGDPVYRRLSAIADEDVPPTACESRSASTA
jgi:hypothetical protein